jgi:hypothetical protein
MANKLWNTGLSEIGNLVAPGQIDQNWTVWPPGVPPPPVKLTEKPKSGDPAFVLSDQRSQPTGPYFLTTDSQWIWANADGAVDLENPNGSYVFQCPFDIESDPNSDINWVEIVGTWGTDNYGRFRIDRTDLPAGSGGGDISLPSGGVVTNYRTKHSFSLMLLQLEVGWHTLEVVVTNEGAPDSKTNPAALNISGLQIRLNQQGNESPFEVAIDPMALVLQGKWYDIYLNAKYQGDPPFDAISRALGKMSPADRRAVLTRATQLATFATEVKKVASAEV